MAGRLCDRRPQLDAAALIDGLVPPPRFAAARLSTYRPDPAQPSQAAAVAAVGAFAETLTAPARRARLRRARPAPGPVGLYLDGGFGVGKTHLLASLWHAAPAPSAYATFVEVTSLVGALGFGATVEALSSRRVLCIDEFELDDPGDTVLVSTLAARLADAGVHLAATSNTQPDDLGEGRFAAADFVREIQGLAARFATVRIDGQDYRHRGLPVAPVPASPAQLEEAAARPGATEDSFAEVCRHLAEVHPSRYGALVAGTSVVVLRELSVVDDQNTALRLVALIDRLYDERVPVVASGVAIDAMFPAELLAGGYRKKYSRALSRLIALAREAHDGAAVS